MALDVDLSGFFPLQDKRVLITGGTGFFGKHLSKAVQEYGGEPYSVGRSCGDLTKWDDTQRLFENTDPDYVIHAAGHNGGIKYNMDFPADILRINLQMGLNIHEICAARGCILINIATSCAYPDLGNTVLTENLFWKGKCNETIRCHGTAKRVLNQMASDYAQQYNLDVRTVAVTNLYGPHDTFNLDRTKVVGAVVRKVVEAKQKELPNLTFWGTGKPKRQFMFAPDAAEAVCSALVDYHNPDEVLNIGSESEFTIKHLVNTTAKLVGYEGDILWDTDKKDGQMRKYMDTDKARRLLSYPQTPFEEGLKETIDWYVANQEKANAGK